jgi:hypothetical protein
VNWSLAKYALPFVLGFCLSTRVFAPTAAAEQSEQLIVYVGYLDNVHGTPRQADTPTPFDPDADTILISNGGTTAVHDTGVIRFQNPSDAPVIINPGLAVTIGTTTFQIWDQFLPITLAPNKNLVLAETGQAGEFNFDSSNVGLGTDAVVSGSVNGQPFSFTDVARVLLGRQDAGGRGKNETTAYQVLGTITEPELVSHINWADQITVNGQSIVADGMIEFRDTGDFQAKQKFTGSTTLADVIIIITGSSLKSHSCTNGGKRIAGAENLISLTGGNYEGVRNFILRDPEGKIVGDITATLTVRRVDDINFNATQTVYGYYNGPTNLLPILTDYDLPLKQMAPGKVGGQYAATFTTTDGDIFVINGTQVYTYTGKRTLPFNEVAKVRYRSFNFDTDTAELSLTGNSTLLPLVSKADRE